MSVDTDRIRMFSTGFLCGIVFGYTNTLGCLTGVFTGLYLNLNRESSIIKYTIYVLHLGKLRATEIFSNCDNTELKKDMFQK